MLHLLEPSDALDNWLSEASFPAYRAAQVRRWIFQKRAGTFDEMTDLPTALRERLARVFQIFTSQIAQHRRAKDGTEKLLLTWPDGQRIECVLLRDGARRTVCVSTQVGCAMGCTFCASGIGGLERNLTSGEIVEQMLLLQRLLDDGRRLSHVVVMGMGEPLANLDRLLPALDWASDRKALGISPRRMTVSTIGLPGPMRRLAQMKCRFNLAVSLHAPCDTLRDRLMPACAKTGLAKTLEAADLYFEASGRRLTYEYILLAGINDSPEHAKQLVALLRGRPALVNLIPYNPVAGLPQKRPSPQAVRRFREILESGGLTVQIRRRKGERIDAACGQLRRSASDAKTPGKPGR